MKLLMASCCWRAWPLGSSANCTAARSCHHRGQTAITTFKIKKVSGGAMRRGPIRSKSYTSTRNVNGIGHRSPHIAWEFPLAHIWHPGPTAQATDWYVGIATQIATQLFGIGWQQAASSGTAGRKTQIDQALSVPPKPCWDPCNAFLNRRSEVRLLSGPPRHWFSLSFSMS